MSDITVQELRLQKMQLELRLARFIEDEIREFTGFTEVPVVGLDVNFSCHKTHGQVDQSVVTGVKVELVVL